MIQCQVTIIVRKISRCLIHVLATPNVPEQCLPSSQPGEILQMAIECQPQNQLYAQMA